MRVVQVVPSIEQEASGPSYTVASLNRALNDVGVASVLVSTGVNQSDEREDRRTFPRRSFLHRLGRSPEMYNWLKDAAKNGQMDILHNHSLWMMPNVYPGWVAKRTSAALIVSPRGTFSRWALEQSRAVKFVFWNALQKNALQPTRLFHATAESEYLDIRRLGFRQPVAILPNGIDVPDAVSRMRTGTERTVLFLSRIHPGKGLENLIDAWARLEGQFSAWTLRIVGPGDPDYLRTLRDRASALALSRLTFAGPFYGPEKRKAYEAADVFVLPTHSENFGVAVAEALASGCPVITTKGAPWSGLTAHRAGWWVEIGVEPLGQALEAAMSKERGELDEMGARGRSWMAQDFSWDRIAGKMIESYRWIKVGGERPPWVFHD